ncbi:MAG TPA: hypothetical protein VFV38_28500, partial [Ktedonobacteraceae bacterium]|nr:hypothetical protein [Ktedonobacteraceae bacterium]
MLKASSLPIWIIVWIHIAATNGLLAPPVVSFLCEAVPLGTGEGWSPSHPSSRARTPFCWIISSMGNVRDA